MRVILDERCEGYVAPESELEAQFLGVVRAAGLPDPERQLDLGDGDDWIGRVDHAYREFSLIIELDSRIHHSSKLDKEADARRDVRLRAAGWRHIERFGWDDVTLRPETVVARLRLYLGTNRTGVTQ